MDFKEHLNVFIEEMVEELITPGQARILLLSEDFAFQTIDGPLLLTEMMRKYRPMSGGGRSLIQVQGRIDPRKSRKASLAAVKYRSKRAAAQRKSTTKMKRKRTSTMRRRMNLKVRGARPSRPKVRRPARRTVMVRKPSSMTRPSGRRGYHGAKRHAAPRVRRR